MKPTSPNTTEPCEVITKDRIDVITLIALGHNPSHVEPIPIPGRKPISMFVFPQTAWQTWKDFKMGRAMPIDDIRKIWNAEVIFNGFVHNDE